MLRGEVTGWTMCWLCRRTQLAGLEGHECDQNRGSGLPGLEGGGARGQVYSPVSRLGGQRCDLRGEDTAFGVPTMESSPRLGTVRQPASLAPGGLPGGGRPARAEGTH